MRLFIAAEAMLFGSLFGGYVLQRIGSSPWPGPIAGFPWLETLLLLGASAAFGAKRSQLIVCNTLSLTFVVITLIGDAGLIGTGITPSTDLRWAYWFTLTGVHAVHVLAGAGLTGWLAGPGFQPGTGPASAREPSDELRRGLAGAASGREGGNREPGTEKDRWLARIDATRRYWLFLDAVWLAIVVSFYIV